MQSAVNKSNRNNNASKPFNDLLGSLFALLKKLYKDHPVLITVVIFLSLFSLYSIIKSIDSSSGYSIVVTGLFVLLSVCLYIKEKSSLSAVSSFSLGLFTAFTVTWNSSTFSIFLLSFLLLLIVIFLISSIRAAGDEEEKLVRAANSYISDFETNMKDLQEIYATAKKLSGLFPIEKKQDAILFFAYHKVKKETMITLMDALTFLYVMTKLDLDLLLILVINIYRISNNDNELVINIFYIKQNILKCENTPDMLIKILNDTFYIAIENNASFSSFTDTILLYLSRGHTPISIVEPLARKFTKKTP